MVSDNGGFRTDVNGLRAWAVLAVVLYHFGVAGFGGGYVGVDIFFVISGFLMTGIIYRALRDGALEQPGAFLWRFYLARGKRILPALIVVCAALLIIGSFTLSDLEFDELGDQVASAVLFVSNIKFWRGTNYFSPAVFDIPLLHTWSLSVEWQFYMVLPLAMMLVWKVRPSRRALLIALAFGGAVSLGLCIHQSQTRTLPAFYLLPYRAWEMIAGGLIALAVRQPLQSQATARAWQLTGLAMIAYAILSFSHLAWPNWRALVPVVGTMLVLLAARQQSPLTNWAPLQWTGRISYSMYLWHWPLAVGLHYLELQRDPLAIACGLALTFALGHLSYVLVETRLRLPMERMPRNAVAATLLAGCAVLALPVLLIKLEHGYAGRLPQDVNAMFASMQDREKRDGCDIVDNGSDKGCQLGGDKLSIIVLGDSHGGAVLGAVAAAMPNRSMGALNWTMGGCPSLQGYRSIKDPTQRCSRFLAWTLERMHSMPANVPVLIVNRSALYMEGENEDGLEYTLTQPPSLYFGAPHATFSEAFHQEVANRMVETACAIAKERPVYLMRPTAEMRLNVPQTLARAKILGRERELEVPLDAYRERTRRVWAAQDEAHSRCGVTILDPLPYLCGEARCNSLAAGKSLYFDDNHLSVHGSRYLTPMFARIFTKVAANAPQAVVLRN